MTDEEIKELDNCKSELRELQSNLRYSDEYGDWKIIKYNEYILTNQDPPYNIKELNLKRQKIRDRINYLTERISELENKNIS